MCDPRPNLRLSWVKRMENGRKKKILWAVLLTPSNTSQGLINESKTKPWRSVHRRWLKVWEGNRQSRPSVSKNRIFGSWWMILFFVPGGYISTLETKQRECWKFWDSRCEFRVWFASLCATFQLSSRPLLSLDSHDKKDRRRTVNPKSWLVNLFFPVVSW